MKIKNGFVLREVCGERVIVGEGLEAINFGRLLCLNETAAWLWKEAKELGNYTKCLIRRIPSHGLFYL